MKIEDTLFHRKKNNSFHKIKGIQITFSELLSIKQEIDNKNKKQVLLSQIKKHSI